MAILSDFTLTNCFYIPDFISPGTIAVFEQTNSPTSWTKNTTHTNKALRIVNGNIVNGGLLDFSSVLTSRSWSGSTSSNPANISLESAAPAIHLGPIVRTATFSNSLSGMTDHTHNYTSNNSASRTAGPFSAIGDQTTFGSVATGGGGQHGHASLPTPTNPFNPLGHAHGAGEGIGSIGNPHTHTPFSSHSHPVSFTQNFSVNYRDIIFASKD
jgi:hypothetical protein